LEGVLQVISLKVRHFRSVQSADLPDCGRFNVLIGKNNSGKSNLLSALNGFFFTIHGGTIVRIEPPFGREIDFFSKDQTSPIEVTISFALSKEEAELLIEEIVSEAPQMRNAAEGIGTSLSITASVTFASRPHRIGYVSSVVVGSSERVGPLAERRLLEVPIETAVEQANRLIALRGANERIQAYEWALRNIDEDDWRRARAGDPTYARFARPPVQMRQFRDQVDDAIRRSESHSEFRSRVESNILTVQDEITSAEEKPLVNKVGTFSGDEQAFPAYARNLIMRLGNVSVLYLRERREPIGRDEAQRLLSYKVSRGGLDVLNSIQETVSTLLGVKIDAFQSSSAGDSIAEMDVDEFVVEVNGSGVREALRLVLDYEFQRPEILLVEEPEIHLHPALETSMMSYLKKISENSQVFITTHSTNFLDTADMRNTYLVTKNGSTNVQLLNLDDAEARIPQELGIRLSSLFMFDRLVLVEGPSDEAVLRQIANTLKVDFSQSNVGFVSMGGARNFAHYAADSVISILTKRRVQVFAVIDRDERDDEEIKRLEDGLGERLKLTVLSRREIENYLLSPRAIVQMIALKRESSRSRVAELPSQEQVEELLSAAADDLKGLAVSKRVQKVLCRPIYPPRGEHADLATFRESIRDELESLLNQLIETQAALDNVSAAQIEEVEAKWESQKFEIVPGSSLLDLVFQKFGVRFRKEQDAGRLASFLSRDEIPADLRSLVSEIGAK
jgi:energy-coupling factor transporter ATP-binding protein EcfA2